VVQIPSVQVAGVPRTLGCLHMTFWTEFSSQGEGAGEVIIVQRQGMARVHPAQVATLQDWMDPPVQAFLAVKVALQLLGALRLTSTVL